VFAVEETHGRALRPGNELLAHSSDSGWQALYAARFREAPLDVVEPPRPHPSLIYHLASPTKVERSIEGGRPERTLIGPGRLCITPRGATAHWRHTGRPEILQIYVRGSVVARALEETHGCGVATPSLAPRFAITDPLLEQLALAVLEALRDGSARDRLYVESIAQLIAVHLARAHSSRSRPKPAAPARALSQVRIRRLLDYIEQNLSGDLSLEVLAAEVDLTALYLVRAFRVTVGESPHRYVVGRRIERAKRILADTATPIADVALASGFSSQSHLSSWFRRVVGVSPAAYRRSC
jgi:AraC family transcriptional regulator